MASIAKANPPGGGDDIHRTFRFPRPGPAEGRLGRIGQLRGLRGLGRRGRPGQVRALGRRAAPRPRRGAPAPPRAPAAPPAPPIRRRRLGAALRRLRLAAGLTLAGAAERLEISDSTLSRLENGQGRLRRIDVSAALDVYGVVDEELRTTLLNL